MSRQPQENRDIGQRNRRLNPADELPAERIIEYDF